MNEKAGYFYDAGRRRLTIVFMLAQWPARNLIAKGFSPDRRILVRPLTPEEARSLAGARRLYFIRYSDWAGLFEDEDAVGVPTDIIEKLRAFARSHPLTGG